MIYKFRPAFKLPYKRQGLIYFACLNHRELCLTEYIEKVILSCAPHNKKALFEAVTTPSTLLNVALENYMDESTLWRACKAFYAAFDISKINEALQKKEQTVSSILPKVSNKGDNI